ncbi:MAG: hypothetical protein ACLFOY_17095 [Desulfatibacillaceae bacterium]
MKPRLIAVCLVIAGMILATPVLAARAPHEIGGLRLGDDIENHADLLRSGSDLPIRYFESVREMEVKDTPGYKSGTVSYGNCRHEGKILRIKLKYLDSSRQFYEMLLSRYKKRFGEPDVWRGDAFGLIRAWKWSFTDQKGHDLSLVLQHNTKVDYETMGNSVKLTDRTMWTEEYECHERRNPEPPDKPVTGEPDWEKFLPQP